MQNPGRFNQYCSVGWLSTARDHQTLSEAVGFRNWYMVAFVNESNPIANLISVGEAATILRQSEQTVRALLKRGEIDGRKIGGTWVLDQTSVAGIARQKGVIGPNLAGSKMAKTRRTTSKMRALSFFSGAMGLDLGLRRAGIETILACEVDKWCRKTIEFNRPLIPLLGDICRYDAAAVRTAANLCADEEIDIVVGGPPCQAFSTAGSRRSFDDVRGNVFLHFLELAIDLNPRFIVVENVRGLLSAPMKHRPHNLRGHHFPPLEGDELPGGAFNFVLHVIRTAGYSISFNLYNSANFGSPQTRERVILVCARDGRKVQYLSPTHSEFPKHNLKTWKTFRDAVVGLENIEHHHVAFPENRLRYYRLLKPGQYWKHLPEDMQREALGNSFHSGGGKTGFFRRLDWDRPSPTLVTHPAMPATDLAHPEEDRPLSIEEYKRVQEFPDKWKLEGPLIQQYKQIGNAVPASLGAALGRVLVAHDSGVVLPILEGFRFSRYRNTDDESWEAKFENRRSGGGQSRQSSHPTLFDVAK